LSDNDNDENEFFWTEKIIGLKRLRGIKTASDLL